MKTEFGSKGICCLGVDRDSSNVKLMAVRNTILSDLRSRF